MKKLITFIICLLSITCNVLSQVYERPKPEFVSEQHRISFCGIYEINKFGEYKYTDLKCTPVPSAEFYLKKSVGNEHFFAHDKKYNRYYFYTDNLIGYYNPTEIAPFEVTAKKIKLSNVPVIKAENYIDVISPIINLMNSLYEAKKDSIINQYRINAEKERIKDSITRAENRIKEYNDYKLNSKWNSIKLKYGEFIACDRCNMEHYEREFNIISINSDTIYWHSENDNNSITILDETFTPIHYGIIPKKIKEDINFKKHMEIWGDSIKNCVKLTNENAFDINLDNYIKFKSNIIKKAPNGFIDNWGWELNSADGIEPYFSYYNTSYKTIKYIDFYFSIYNPVGDKCLLKYPSTYIGKVRGVGPVEPWDGGSWSWDRATHYTSADASEMRIVKIVISYMDKTTKILTGNNIKFE